MALDPNLRGVMIDDLTTGRRPIKEDDLGGFYFDQNVFENHHQQWKYPLHMIDFETSTTALPFLIFSFSVKFCWHCIEQYLLP